MVCGWFLTVCFVANWVLAAELPRKWRDASGKFEIDATLVELGETKVKLKKTDGSVIEVPIARLSDADQKYLKGPTEPAPADDPFAGGSTSPVAASPRPRFPKPNSSVPAGTVLADQGKLVALGQGDPPQGVAPDPATMVRPLAVGGFPVSDVDAYDKVSPPLIVEPEQGLVAVSIGRNIINRQNETRGRIYLGKLPGGPASLVWDHPEALALLDHDPATDRTLIMSGLDHFERGGDVVVLEGLSQGVPKEVYRRKLPGMEKPGFKPQIGWGALIDGDYMLGQLDSKLYVWNLATAETVYMIDKLTSGKHPALSPGRRYMSVPVQNGVNIVQTIDGTSVGYLVAGGVLTPDVSFHPDGQRIALCANNQLIVYDLVKGDETVNALFSRPFGYNSIGWVGKELYVTGMGDLIRTDLEMVLWNYGITGAVKATGTPAGVLLATTGQKCNLASLPIPSPGATKASGQLEKSGDAMMLVRPGSEVAISAEVPPGVERDMVLQSLREAIERTGWKIVNKSDTTVMALIGRAPQKQLEYKKRTIGGGAGETVETATITPFTAKLEIRRGTQVLWTRETTNHVPRLMFLKDGETLQTAVSKYEKPDAEFFARLDLPPRIPKPELAAGLGSSRTDGAQWVETAAGATPGPTNNRRTNRLGGR